MQPLVSGLVEVHLDFVLIHPFREGNGRIARLLMDVMACQAGIGPLDYSAWDHNRVKRFQAARRQLGRRRACQLNWQVPAPRLPKKKSWQLAAYL